MSPEETFEILTGILNLSPENPKHIADAILETHEFLGAFANWRKATFSAVVSFRLSAWNKAAPTRWILIKFDI
jgi:hypothetical protein